MATKIISDLHSAVDAMQREVSEEDTLLLLGDLVNIIDYREMDGILVEVFGGEVVRQVVDLRSRGQIDEARQVMAKRRLGREQEVGATFAELLEHAYQEVKRALRGPTYIISGNIDPPRMVQSLGGDGVELVDGKVIEVEGLRVGFVGGGLPTPLHVAGEIPEEEYDRKLRSLGEVDVVCSHVPPDLPDLTFDTLARRHERGSTGLLQYIRDVKPQQVIFGHIHQPLMSSTHIGPTHLVNAGYFRRTQRALRLRPL